MKAPCPNVRNLQFMTQFISFCLSYNEKVNHEFDGKCNFDHENLSFVN